MSPDHSATASSGRVLVTGATGNVGAAALRLLVGAGRAVRAGLHRLPAGPPGRDGSAAGGAEHVRLDFRDASTFGPALRGIRRVLLVRPPAIADVEATLVPFIAAAEHAGVEHVVFLSLQGAGRNPVVPNRKVERALKGSDLAWTLLRPSFFMQNLSGTHRAEIRDRGELYVPAGRGRTAFVDARDVAAVAFRALAESGHEGRAYTLTGPAALSYAEVAQVLSDVLGRPVRYADPSLPAFWRRRRESGDPAAFVAVMAALYTVCRLGLAAGVTGELEGLLGRPATPLRAFAEDHRAVWDPSPTAGTPT